MSKSITSGNTPYVYRYGTAPNTALVNTLKVKLFSFDDATDNNPVMVQIGVLQEWTPADSRTNTAVRSIGYGDQIAEINPGSTELTGSASVMALYTRNIMQVFGYIAGVSGLVRSLKHHRWPFDIREEIVLPLFIQDGPGTSGPGGSAGDAVRRPEAPSSSAIVTYYEGCWMNDYNRSYTIGDVSVTETSAVIITDVYDPFSLGGYGEGMVTGNGAQNAGTSRLFNASLATGGGVPSPTTFQRAGGGGA